MIYPKDFEKKIGFDKIRELISNYCKNNRARELVNKMSFSTNVEEISIYLDETYEMKNICLYDDSFYLSDYPDIDSSLKKLSIKGLYLEIEEIIKLKLFIEALHLVLNFFKNKKEENQYPNLCSKSLKINYLNDVLNKINKIIDSTGNIKDNASKELEKIRNEISHVKENISKKLLSILSQLKTDGITAEDTSLTIRNGRLVIPVPVTSKRKIDGLIHDQSATGKTLYIEPASVVELNNRLRELEYEEHREIIKILKNFTEEISSFELEISNSFKYLVYIDFLRAKALFSIDINAEKPIISNKKGFSIKNAVHPLLYLHHKNLNREVVPLDIWLTEDKPLLLISGPNAGGKSVCLKTVGLLQYMIQCGCLIPANENSQLTIFKKIFIDIGDEQSIENDLSTYSSHLLNLKFFLENGDNNTLILIDEFGSGTEPTIGGAIAEAVLEEFCKLGVFGIITTHFSNLKNFASTHPRIQNGAMMFDLENIKPLYKLVIGTPGSSFAVDIARQIGLPEYILQRATEKAGKNYILMDRSLRKIHRDKQYWHEKKENIKQKEKRINNILETYLNELENLKKQQKKIIEEAKVKAQEIINEANKKVEQTIKAIKESQAEKQKTQEARKQLEEIKKNIENFENSTIEIDKKIETIEKKLNIKKENKIEENNTLKVGDIVEIKENNLVGEIIDINNNKATIAIGNLTTIVDIDKIEKTDKKLNIQSSLISKSSILKNIEEKRSSFKPWVDVRGKKADEVLKIVEQFIDDAILLGVNQVKILHGKGDGVLRKVIREYLKTLEFVESYHDEHADAGGAGITIVNLKI